MPQRAGAVAAGDVTGKGIRAVLVMASTRALPGAAAPPLIFLGAALGQVGDLFAGIAVRIFVTLVPDPSSGEVDSAKVRHGVRYVRSAGGVASGTVHRAAEPARVRVLMTGGGQ